MNGGNNMNGTKNLITSKTFWGAIVMIASVTSTYFKVDLGDQTEWINSISGVVGSVLAIIGRVKAVKKIG